MLHHISKNVHSYDQFSDRRAEKCWFDVELPREQSCLSPCRCWRCWMSCRDMQGPTVVGHGERSSRKQRRVWVLIVPSDSTTWFCCLYGSEVTCCFSLFLRLRHHGNRWHGKRDALKRDAACGVEINKWREKTCFLLIKHDALPWTYWRICPHRKNFL